MRARRLHATSLAREGVGQEELIAGLTPAESRALALRVGVLGPAAQSVRPMERGGMARAGGPCFGKTQGRRNASALGVTARTAHRTCAS